MAATPWSRPPRPADLHTFLETNGCVVAQHHVRTIKFHTSDRTQLGFVGQVRYVCRTPDPTCMMALNALARLAFFTGVGYQTARGMGVVKTEVWGEG